ncbi:hypothetical protein D9M71_676560 [compost metagenome]
MLDVVGRAATVQAVAVGALVDLGQGALEEAAGHADQGGHPHPEHRTRATQGDGEAHTGDVAGADAAGKAQHQGLEGTQLAGLATDGFLEHTEHVAEVAELDEAGAKGEIGAEPDDEHYEHFPREEIVDHFKHERDLDSYCSRDGQTASCGHVSPWGAWLGNRARITISRVAPRWRYLTL